MVLSIMSGNRVHLITTGRIIIPIYDVYFFPFSASLMGERLQRARCFFLRHIFAHAQVSRVGSVDQGCVDNNEIIIIRNRDLDHRDCRPPIISIWLIDFIVIILLSFTGRADVAFRLRHCRRPRRLLYGCIASAVRNAVQKHICN